MEHHAQVSLKCSPCYVDAGEQEADGVLSTQEAFSVIDQIRATDKPVVNLSGGEPLLRKDIYEIARYRTGLRMVVGTSGYLISRDTAKNSQKQDRAGAIVYPCPFARSPEFLSGNIRDRPFSLIWADSQNPVLARFREKDATFTFPRQEAPCDSGERNADTFAPFTAPLIPFGVQPRYIQPCQRHRNPRQTVVGHTVGPAGMEMIVLRAAVNRPIVVR